MKDDGGAAFPIPGYVGPRGHNEWVHAEAVTGMTLRDWFAGQATEEDVRTFIHRPSNTPEQAQRYRIAAKYAYADAMIAERKKGE